MLCLDAVLFKSKCPKGRRQGAPVRQHSGTTIPHLQCTFVLCGSMVGLNSNSLFTRRKLICHIAAQLVEQDGLAGCLTSACQNSKTFASRLKSYNQSNLVTHPIAAPSPITSEKSAPHDQMSCLHYQGFSALRHPPGPRVC